MTTMAEPEWDADTRNLVLGLDAVDICPACYGPVHLCQDPANEFAWQVPPPVRCHKTTAVVTAQRRVTEETNPIPQALLWRAVLHGDRRPGDG